LEQVAEEQDVEFREGDVLIVRSGFVKWHNEADEEDKVIRDGKGTYVGVEANEKSAEWLWNKHFSLVAGDRMAFEAWPPNGTNSRLLNPWMKTDD
jgi:hypothetical protein